MLTPACMAAPNPSTGKQGRDQDCKAPFPHTHTCPPPPPPPFRKFPTQSRANGESLNSLVRRLAGQATTSSSKSGQETPSAAAPKGPQTSASPGTRQDSNQGPLPAGPASKAAAAWGHSVSSSSSSEEVAREGDEAVVKVHPSAVTNPGFLLPTNPKYDAGGWCVDIQSACNLHGVQQASGKGSQKW